MRYIIYCRKSSEAEDRQVLSIESQINELKKLAERLNLKVVEILTESQSAKEPGRTVFNKMIRKINQGKADGIICWKLDRLARNPIDGGQIIWMLQKGKIKHIQTFDRAYYPEDNVLLMSVEFGMANQFILDLSKNVKRGLKSKCEKGWFPTRAPLGYLNTRWKEKGKNEVIKDPRRFKLVKRMWELMLRGGYSPPAILKIANNQWGLRTPHEKPLSRSAIYRIFANPFYCGLFEYPKGSGNWYKGKHEPMISIEEYDRVQILLGRKDNPRPKKHDFPFRGLIRCGECGAMVTPDEKNQLICPNCKYKFSYNNKLSCPKCKIQIEDMKKPVFLRYLYYHCTKRKDPKCSQSSLEIKELEKQIDEFLAKIEISEGFKNWAVKYLREENEKEKVLREEVLKSQQRAYEQCQKKLSNLLELRLSPLNTDGSLLSDEEYAKRKAELIKEKTRLEEILKEGNKRIDCWLETAEKTFDFACHARYWFKNGTPEEKSQILQALGSNLILKDKKLRIELKKPFQIISDVLKGVERTKPSFEPEKRHENKFKLDKIYSKSPVLCPKIDEVRTWIIENMDSFYVPSFKERLSKSAS